MSNKITELLQAKFKTFAKNMTQVIDKTTFINKAYFSTDASTSVLALVAGTDGASLNTKLTKTEYISGITLVEELVDFFNNGAVTTGDYLSTLMGLTYGSAAVAANLSDATEDIADRMVALASDLFEYYDEATLIKDLYDNSDLSVLVANANAGTVVYGASMTVSDLNSAITLVEQFLKIFNNEAVNQALYSDTVATWQSIDL